MVLLLTGLARTGLGWESWGFTLISLMYWLIEGPVLLFTLGWETCSWLWLSPVVFKAVFDCGERPGWDVW